MPPCRSGDVQTRRTCAIPLLHLSRETVIARHFWKRPPLRAPPVVSEGTRPEKGPRNVDHTRHPKPPVVVAIIRVIVVAGGRARVPRIIAPRAAAQHARLLPGRLTGPVARPSYHTPAFPRAQPYLRQKILRPATRGRSQRQTAWGIDPPHPPFSGQRSAFQPSAGGGRRTPPEPPSSRRDYRGVFNKRDTSAVLNVNKMPSYLAMGGIEGDAIPTRGAVFVSECSD